MDINELCIVFLVALHHHIERRLIVFAACTADGGKPITGSEFKRSHERTQETRKESQSHVVGEINKRLALDQCAHFNVSEPLRLLANAYKHDENYMSKRRTVLEQQGRMGLAAGVRAVDAIGDALLGNCEATHALAEPPSFGGQHSYYAPQALVALALCGQTAELHSLAQGLAKKPLQAWWWNLVELPEIQAATQLGSGKPEVAIELLQAVIPYESRFLLPAYLRRLAYLKLRKGVKAAIDFQKITAKTGAYWTLSNPGILGRNPPGPLYALSYLGLARAEALSGDVAGSRKAYQDLFTLWKDADPDLAILSQARKEYAALQ